MLKFGTMGPAVAFPFVLLLVYLCSNSYCATYDDSVNLMDKVLDGYVSRQRPVLDQSHGIVVSLGFYLLTIQDFDEVAEKFSAYGLLYITWSDQVITWDPKDYGGAYSALFKLSDVWYPKLVLTNPYSKLSDLGDDWMIVRIYNSGYTSFVPGAVFDTSCSADVTYYPFDTQTCALDFNVWGYVGTEVYLIPFLDEVDTTSFTENGEWALDSTSVTRIPGGLSTSDTIRFSFSIKRKSTFLIINVILPIVFMAVINMLVFLLPAESGERLSYSVTVLLALAVFMTLVGDNLPKTSEPMPVLSYYLMILLILSTLMTVTTIFNLNIYFKKGQVPACWRRLYRIIFCFPCRFRKKKIHKNNKVYPNDCINDSKTPIETVDISDREEPEPEITWQDLSVAVDWIALAVFFVGTIIVNAVFLVILAKNKDVAFN
ncbi:neuronal acetylcholine receptor subunit beta-3-like [Mercenaria mercenaria]|uniref:neuronal acetylcholine receptor subunit beta-3-like n=1 Tax=Mercenaria mercenaria TaxID=6596 RepID=UPI00234EAFDB|nr:neuronal acetylcholine receptor subunit beta-3-like [Mercenaria mercenaria]